MQMIEYTLRELTEGEQLEKAIKTDIRELYLGDTFRESDEIPRIGEGIDLETETETSSYRVVDVRHQFSKDPKTAVHIMVYIRRQMLSQ